jgi:hypothetical protein
MKKIINRLIDDAVKGVDVYHYKGSVWFIFTDKKEWVIELDKTGDLWFNYDFFTNIFKYLSIETLHNKHYITEWVENAIQNVVKNTTGLVKSGFDIVEDTLQNGVKNTLGQGHNIPGLIEDTIQNGVKNTYEMELHLRSEVEDIIENGTKHL